MKKIVFVLMFAFALTGCTKTYDDGSVYDGSIDILLRPHKQGTLTMANGDVYTGEFEHGIISGQGQILFANGDSYEGEFLDDQINGEGVYRLENGDVHTGEFVDGSLDGTGRIDFKSGYVKEGTFKQGELIEGYATTIIDLEELTIDVSNGEYVTPDYFFILSSQQDLIEALATAMHTGERVYINTQDFGSVVDEMTHSDYGYAPMFDNATNTLINEYKSYNPTFQSPKVSTSENIPYLSAIDLRFELTEYELEQLDQEVERIVSTKINDSMSDFEIVKTLHDYVADKVVYYDDYENAVGNVHHTAYGALMEGSAVCDGYMDALHLLLDEAGIESYNISGDDLDSTDNYWHAWNLVKMGDDYYHIDLTWNDTSGNKIVYDYFGKTDAEISEDHIIFPFNDVPAANGETYDYYPLVARNGWKTYVYYSNATYYGQINASKVENGYGQIWFNDGSKYYGNFSNGEKTNGKYFYSNGDTFEGDFVNGSAVYGTYRFTNGDYFVGEMTQNGFGYGTYTWASGHSETRNFND